MVASTTPVSIDRVAHGWLTAAVVLLVTTVAVPANAQTPERRPCIEAPDSESSGPANDGTDGDVAGPDGDRPDRPWAVDISPADRERASALYEEAKKQKSDLMVADALALFQQALALYPHPKIHGHLALILHGQNQPRAAFGHLEAALAHGQEGFGCDLDFFEEVQERRRQIEHQIARLTVRTAAAGMRVRIDGEAVLVGPGRHTEVVEPGSHTIDAERDGYLAESATVELKAGQRVVHVPELVSMEAATATIRRWSNWKPWSVFASGAALGAIGIALHVQAHNDVATFDQHVATSCRPGCADTDLPASVQALPDRARWRSGLGTGALTVGALALTAGATLLYLNRPSPRHPELMRGTSRASLSPLLAPGVVGAHMRWRF